MIFAKKGFWITISVLVVGLLIYFGAVRKPKIEYVTSPARKGNLVQTVSASATLKADETVNLNFETGGRISSIEAFEGRKVAKDEIIATIDDANLESAVDQAKANLDKARADAGISDDSIDTAEVALENAKDYLSDTKDLNSKNVNAAEQTLEDAREYLEDADSYYDIVVAESGEGSSTAKLARLTVNTAQSRVNSAEDSLEVAKKQADLSETSAENSKKTAEANLDAARSKFITAGKNALIASYEAAYESALANLDKSVLRSPISGVIKKVNYHRGEVLGSSAALPFAQIISSDFVLEASVSESDIAGVKVGQKATVTFDALSDEEKFTAEVISIDPSSTVVQDVVDYEAKLSLQKLDQRLKDGMSADIDVSTGGKSDVLLIQERAVSERDGKKFVQVLIEEKPVDKEVVLGMSGDEGLVEVISGLQGGEEVITSTK